MRVLREEEFSHSKFSHSDMTPTPTQTMELKFTFTSSSMLTNMADDPSTLFPGIPRQDILDACETLTILIPADSDDHRLLLMPAHVWVLVSELLNRDPSLNRPLAKKDDFNKNVNKRGLDSFLNLLRERAKDVGTSGSRTRWVPLFCDGTSLYFSLKCSGHFPF